jgi:hypothetical protein
MNKGTGTAVAVLGIVAALAVGTFTGYAIKNNNMDSNMSNTATTESKESATKVADLRVGLNNLLRQHVSTNLQVNRDIIDGASQSKIDGSKAAQTANAVAIAETVGSVYGDDAKAAITTPFVEHLNQSNNYSQAVKDGNMAAQESSLAALRAELRKVADVFASVIPSVSSDSLYEALSAHEDLMNKASEEYKAGNYEAAAKTEDEAMTQISGGAEVLATGIVASKPDMF